jgi:hypothetical protein
LRPKLHSDPLMIHMREVSGRLPGCETRSTFQPRWITLQREAVVAPAARMKFDEVHPLVRIHHLRRTGRKAAVCDSSRGIKKPGQRLLACTHIGLGVRARSHFPLSTAKSPPSLHQGGEAKKSTFPRSA